MPTNLLSIPKKNLNIKNLFLNAFLILFSISFISCSSSVRYTKNETDVNADVNENFADLNSIRVLISDQSALTEIKIQSDVYLADDSKRIALIRSGNKLKLQSNGSNIILEIKDQSFTGKEFYLSPSEAQLLKVNDKSYRGRIKFVSNGNVVVTVNQLGLEDYVKGVMTKEMPIGKDNQYNEALKAFSICVRTYAYLRLFEGKQFFDVYGDTRDQVYGGVEGESELTNQLVDQTKNLILKYNNEPAIIFYHSTCGGFTEDAKNVFTNAGVPYLIGHEDGANHFCSISPRYEWEESYSEQTFIQRLKNANLIKSGSGDISIQNIEVVSRFNSGRVNELRVNLRINSSNETIILQGNSMRSVIRSADGKSILKSTLFDISLDNDKNIIINGKGNGHGVGLCQWGAIGRSIRGFKFDEIIESYFPGTEIKPINDKQ